MASRILLFLLANFGVLAVLSVSMRLLGVDAYLASQGGAFQLNGLLIMAAILGFAGSFISLAMSKTMAKRAMGVQIIEQPRGEAERWLLAVVRRQAEAAGIGMPEVGIFESPTMNAFATGMNRDDALVAVSTGLLASMSRDEVEAVLGHEVSHVANGDMVTMGLLQGVLNTFVIFFSRVIGIVIDRTVFRIERGVGPGFWIGSIVAEIVLGIIAAMIAALDRLRRGQGQSDLPGEIASFGINGKVGLAALLATHPPLELRIERLRAASD